MAKGKIAPVLAQVVKWSAAGEDARREYRALVAVARAAKGLNKLVWPDGTPDGVAHGDLARALARLDRVSGGKP